MDKSTGSTRGPNCNSGGGGGGRWRGAFSSAPEVRCAEWPNCVKEEAKYAAAPTHALVCPDWPECAEK